MPGRARHDDERIYLNPSGSLALRYAMMPMATTDGENKLSRPTEGTGQLGQWGSFADLQTGNHIQGYVKEVTLFLHISRMDYIRLRKVRGVFLNTFFQRSGREADGGFHFNG